MMNTAQDLIGERLVVSLDAPEFQGSPLAVLDLRGLPWRDERLVCVEVSRTAFSNINPEQHALFVMGELGDSVWLTDQDERQCQWVLVDNDDPTPGFRIFECASAGLDTVHLYVQDDLDVFDRMGRKL